jgi:uncharacterized RDD family membrane protein YckC
MENTPEILPSSTEPSLVQPQFSMGGYLAPVGKLTGVGFGRRAAARIIDFCVTYVFGLVAGFSSGIVIVLAAAATHQPYRVVVGRLQGFHLSTIMAAVAAGFFYEFILEGLHGSTAGKQMMGIVVVQEDGSPCSLKGAAIRSLGYFVDAMFFGIVGYTAMKRDESHQRYGDDWAHTVVVQKTTVSPEKRRGGGVFAAALALGAFANIITMMIATLMLALG